MINSCTLEGNVGKYEQKTTRGGESYSQFSVALNLSKEREADPLWLRVSAFGKTAEILGVLAKGERVVVSGRLEVNDYDGTRYWQMVAQSVSRIAKQTQAYQKPPDEEVDPWADE